MTLRQSARAGLAALVALGSAAVSRTADSPPTFARDIAPILYSHCTTCHQPGAAGPFSLLTYDDARKRARLIAQVTRSRFMPPWLAEHGYGDFAGERRLADTQIKMISDWAAAGAPEGDPRTAPQPPQYTEGWQLGPPDLVLTAPAAFTTPATGPDVYWNFVFHTGMKSVRYLRAVDIRPGAPGAVHHANLLIDRMASAHEHEASPGAGFPGMDLDIQRSPFDPEGQFLYWKPGNPRPHEEPSGFASRLNPSDELVLNVHMHPTGKPETVRPVIGLYFTDEPQTRFPLLVELEADNALRIPAGARDFTVGDDFKLPLDADLLAVYPHAHYLGRRMEAWAVLPNGTRQWLIRVPDWNPAWQGVFYYREPVSLPRGTVISMRWHYDNSAANPRNPNSPPKLVTGGNQITDEMAHFRLQLLPHGARDQRRELDEAVLHHRLEKDPADFSSNFNLGAVQLSRLNPNAAVASLETAVRAEPARADARNMLGLALAATGRNGDAIAQYEASLRLHEDGRARFNLANAQVKAGRLDDAVENYRRAMEAFPDDPLPKQRLEETLALRDQRRNERR